VCQQGSGSIFVERTVLEAEIAGRGEPCGGVRLTRRKTGLVGETEEQTAALGCRGAIWPAFANEASSLPRPNRGGRGRSRGFIPGRSSFNGSPGERSAAELAAPTYPRISRRLGWYCCEPLAQPNCFAVRPRGRKSGLLGYEGVGNGGARPSVAGQELRNVLSCRHHCLPFWSS
jgi:hypothetical protein